MKKFFAIILLITLLLSGCAAAGSTPDEATKDEATVDEPATQAPTQPPNVEQQAKEEYDAILQQKPKGKGSVKVEAMDQFPELPAGCEAEPVDIEEMFVLMVKERKI